ncbi:lycopene elongase [Halonotius aquaticus]|uniref:Lycopene elongase n=1 Tax=Halonotius aquaticus TaxID=2216978 RepID=A0A3A6PQX1_9EURY|nr:prenyltransferase [Halonotius aquaticus]RJX44181.1 lycopene elongase [Halonotius aquaticus]
MTAVGTDQSNSTATDGLRYLLILSRPRFWFYLAGPVVVGVAAAAETVPDLFLPVGFALFGYFLLPANVLLYGVNDIFDADIDTENPKKTEREARWQGGPAVIASVVASGLLAVPLFAIASTAAWPWIAGFLLLAVEYSAPPARFKTTPLLDSLSNGLYILPGIAAYAAVAGTQPPAMAVVGAWLWTMGMHTFSAIPDIDPDRRAGIRTTATWLGKRRTYGYVAACWLAAAGAFAVVDLRLGVLMAVYPVFVAWVATSSVAVDRAYWWFPALNTAVGTLFTLGLLWRIVPPTEVLP